MASVYSLESDRNSMAGTQYQTKFGSNKYSILSAKKSKNSKSPPSNKNEDLKVSIDPIFGKNNAKKTLRSPKKLQTN